MRYTSSNSFLPSGLTQSMISMTISIVGEEPGATTILRSVLFASTTFSNAFTIFLIATFLFVSTLSRYTRRRTPLSRSV